MTTIDPTTGRSDNLFLPPTLRAPFCRTSSSLEIFCMTGYVAMFHFQNVHILPSSRSYFPPQFLQSFPLAAHQKAGGSPWCYRDPSLIVENLVRADFKKKHGVNESKKEKKWLDVNAKRGGFRLRKR